MDEEQSYVDAAPAKRIRIEADDREARSQVVSALRADDSVEVRLVRLPVGDYLIDQRILVERKTLIDLTLSIADGRLFSQARRLAAAAQMSLVVLEGTAKDLASVQMRREAVQGALVSLTLFFGVPLLRARDAAETARLILFAARQGQRIETGAWPRKGCRPRGKRRVQCNILQGLPGIGAARAERLLEQFGSVAAVVNADADQLAETPGIGPSLAKAIRWAVQESAGSYLTTQMGGRSCDQMREAHSLPRPLGEGWGEGTIWGEATCHPLGWRASPYDG